MTSDDAIDGVQVVPLRRIPDERGTILHMLRSTDQHFIEFGEIYFSTVYAEVVKGWHKHREMTLNYACIYGRDQARALRRPRRARRPAVSCRRSSSGRTTTRSW